MADHERGLPHNWETERAVLGGILVAPERLDDVREVVSDRQFHRPAHAALFRVMCELADAGSPPDTIVVLDALEARQMTDTAGGVSYVISLPQACASVDHVVAYARRVADTARMRHLVLVGQQIEQLGRDQEVSAEAAASTAMTLLYGVVDGGAEAKGWARMGDLAAAQLEAIRERAENPEQAMGVTTGLRDLDRKINGLQAGKLYIIPGRPAMGKSALMQVMAQAAARQVGVGVISLEMGGAEIAERALVSEAHSDAGAVRRGEVDQAVWRRLMDAAQDLDGLPLYVDDSPAASIAQIRGKARRLRAMCPTLGVVFVDYLQLASADVGKGSRQEEIAKVSRGLKALAKELGIAVVALAQLSRKCDDRTDKRPMPSDLRESGQIEQDADVILMVYRDEVYNADSADRGVAELIVCKHRGGEIGTVKVAFLGNEVRFADLARDADPRPDYHEREHQW
jgi:replicative DNA helicase